MGFFAKLVSAVLRERPGDQPLVDEPTKKLLLSAAGNVGGDLCDLLLPAARTEEQAIVVSWETGFFGVAAACHFFTVRYAKEIPPLSLATEVADAYRKHCLKLNAENLGSDGADRIDQYFEVQSQHALASTLGALYMLAEHPDKLSWELSRVLSQRIRLNCALRLEVERIDQVKETINRSFYALMTALETLIGTELKKRSLNEQELFKRAQSCLGKLLIQSGQSGFKRMVETGHLGFTSNSVFYCADFDKMDSDTICYVKLSDFPMLKTVRPALEGGPMPMIPEELVLACLEIAKSVKPWKR